MLFSLFLSVLLLIEVAQLKGFNSCRGAVALCAAFSVLAHVLFRSLTDSSSPCRRVFIQFL